MKHPKRTFDPISFLILISLTVSALNFLPGSSALQELHANFGGYFLSLNIITFLLVISFRKRTFTRHKFFFLVSAHIVVALPLLLVLAPYALPRSGQELQPNAREVKIFSLNLEQSNTNVAAVQQAIHDANPDIVALLEFTPTWQHALQLEKRFPVAITFPDPGCFGLALYGPPELTGQISDMGDGFPKIVEASLSASNPIKIFLSHSIPPLSNRAYELDTLIARRFATQLRHERGNALLITDLNATPFSPLFRRIRNGGETRSAMEGFGLQRTWNTRHFFMRLTLDHLFYKGDLAVKNFTVLPEVGSDHFPLLVQFTLLAPGSNIKSDF